MTNVTVALTWKPKECLDRNGVSAHYVVQYSQGHGDDTVNITVGVSQSYTVSSLASNTTYRFQVAVVNSNITGPFSDPISITTLVEGKWVTTLRSISMGVEMWVCVRRARDVCYS